MTTTVGYILSWVICVGITLVGARFLLAPRASAAGYGVPFEPWSSRPAAYLSVKAVRDLASGLVILALLLAGPASALGWFMLAAAIIPVGDALIVLRYGGPKMLAYAMHGVTAVVMVAGAVLLLAR
jgi:hypothetical protein